MESFLEPSFRFGECEATSGAWDCLDDRFSNEFWGNKFQRKKTLHKIYPCSVSPSLKSIAKVVLKNRMNE